MRLGRYGPFAQIGVRDEEEPPKFASLRPGQSIHTISKEEALELFRLPRSLGTDADGNEITVGIGRFGPFVKRGTVYASLRKEDDPYKISLDRGLELLRLKEEAIANRTISSFDDGRIQVLRGRFGPFATDGTLLASLPRDIEPESFTLEQAEAPAGGKGQAGAQGPHGEEGGAQECCQGRRQEGGRQEDSGKKGGEESLGPEGRRQIGGQDRKQGHCPENRRQGGSKGHGGGQWHNRAFHDRRSSLCGSGGQGRTVNPAQPVRHDPGRRPVTARAASPGAPSQRGRRHGHGGIRSGCPSRAAAGEAWPEQHGRAQPAPGNRA